MRGLRRWVVVAVIWALAGTAIALIALLDEEEASEQTDPSSTRVTRLDRKLSREIDALERRLESRADASAVSSLTRRVEQAEQRAQTAANNARQAASGDDSERLRNQIQQLQSRVEELESQQSQQDGPPMPDEQP